MKIKVLHCKKVFPLDITYDKTIKILLKIIKEQLNLKAPINHFILKYNYRNLDKDYMKVEQCNIRNNSFIELKNILDEPNIKLKFINEELELIFPCFFRYSIIDYKIEIKKIRGYPIE